MWQKQGEWQRGEKWGEQQERGRQGGLVSPIRFNKISYLLGFYVALFCVSVCFAHYIINISGIPFPGGTFAFSLSFLICDVVGEVYGYSVARNFVWVGVTAELAFAGMSELMLIMPHLNLLEHSMAYQTVFAPTLGFVLSGVAGFLIGEFINIYFLAKLKIKLAGRHFIFRSLFSTAIGQATLCVMVIFLAFHGQMSSQELRRMMFAAWAVKMAYSAIFVVPAWLFARYLKRSEGIDVYDKDTNFNPFKL